MVNTQSNGRKCSTSDDDGSREWASLPDDLLILIMLHLGVFDFIALSGVCKSWRSIAVSNWNKFMVSKQPMFLSISDRKSKKDCYLEDYTRRKMKTMIPHSSGRICIGLTYGYMIFFGRNTNDFWLVNPFTRKELHFPGFPRFSFDVSPYPTHSRGILVFSPSMSGFVLVILPQKYANEIWFSLAGKQARWRCILCDSPIRDLHFFKGKVYALNHGSHLYELRLGPRPILILHKMKNFPWSGFKSVIFVSSDEHLYGIDILASDYGAYEADLKEMKWVNSDRTIGECAVFVSMFKCDAAIKRDTWIHPCTHYKRLNFAQFGYLWKIGHMDSTTNMWYFPHECLKDNDSGPLLNKLEE